MKRNDEIIPIDIPSDVSFAAEHYPVLIREILGVFSGFKSRPDLKYFDGTFGRGGHYRAIKAMIGNMSASLFDQDLAAIEFGKAQFSREVESRKANFVHANFSEFSQQKFGDFDMMLLDLGVSSPQLDEAERGFSFYHDGPLDMRMNRRIELTAADIIHEASEKEMIELFQQLGEINRPHRVVRAIVHDRKEKRFETTRDLASLIERVDGWNKKGHHPATRYFMALRLRVNSELEVLQATLPELMKALKPKGRLAVISFHSLEDRIVKNIFRERTDLGEPITKKVVIPTDEECEKNSRSRSAKLRIFERRDPNEVQDEHSKYKTTKAIF